MAIQKPAIPYSWFLASCFLRLWLVGLLAGFLVCWLVGFVKHETRTSEQDARDNVKLQHARRKEGRRILKYILQGFSRFFPRTEPLSASRSSLDSHYHDYYSHFSIIFITFSSSDAMILKYEHCFLIRISTIFGLFTIETIARHIL